MYLCVLCIVIQYCVMKFSSNNLLKMFYIYIVYSIQQVLTWVSAELDALGYIFAMSVLSRYTDTQRGHTLQALHASSTLVKEVMKFPFRWAQGSFLWSLLKGNNLFPQIQRWILLFQLGRMELGRPIFSPSFLLSLMAFV